MYLIALIKHLIHLEELIISLGNLRVGCVLRVRLVSLSASRLIVINWKLSTYVGYG
jgi:hypothetical protein